jgi:hypothetical protein
MTTKRNKPDATTKRKRGRPYTPRPCIVCGNEAAIALQIRTRGLGPGTHVVKVTAYTGPLLLCDRCSRSRDYGTELIDKAAELLGERPRRSIPRGPGLFAVAESAIQ